MFLVVPAYPGCPGSKAVKRSLSSSVCKRPRHQSSFCCFYMRAFYMFTAICGNNNTYVRYDLGIRLGFR